MVTDHWDLIAFTMIKMTAEFFIISEIKFWFNLGSIPLN